METTRAFEGLSCTGCGAAYGVEVVGRCPDCGDPLSPAYDLGAVDAEAFAAGRDPDRGAGMWTFEPLLPFPRSTAVSAGEGGTPLVGASTLAAELGVGSIGIKDESRNPTGTILDRGLSLAVTAAAGHAAGGDVEPLALASPGNAAQSAAAYAGRADLRSYAFVPSRCAFSNKAMVNVHGGEMRVAGGRFDDALAALEDQLAADHYSLQEFTTPYRHDAARTVAFELLADREWDAPDAVFVPTGTGELLVGIVDGLETAVELGLVGDLPEVVAVQPDGCAPIVDALDRGVDATDPVEYPDTIVGELEIPAPAGGALALRALERVDGRGVSVPDDEILESAVSTCAREVVEMGVAGGAAAAGARALADAFGPDAELVVVNTESATKTPDVLRSHLMGKGV